MSSTMPQATNIISNDDSMQAEALGTACFGFHYWHYQYIVDSIRLDDTVQEKMQEIFDETYSMKTTHSSFIET